MKIKFLRTETVEDSIGQTFEEGQVYDLPEPSALRWIKRKAAVLVDREELLAAPIKHKETEPKKANVTAEEPEAEPEVKPEPKQRHR